MSVPQEANIPDSALEVTVHGSGPLPARGGQSHFRVLRRENWESPRERLPLETIRCIFCGDPATAPVVIEENGFTGRKCPRCGLIYVSPRPKLSEILAIYEQDAACFRVNQRTCNNRLKRLQARHNLAIVKRHCTTVDTQREAFEALAFKLDMLWAMIDTIHHAYLD